MKEPLKAWLGQLQEPNGALALGMRFPDRSVVVKTATEGFPATALEQSLRGLAETFQVLALHRSTAQRLTFVFEKARIFAAQRPDGICLGLYMPAGDKTFNGGHFSALAQQFLTLASR